MGKHNSLELYAQHLTKWGFKIKKNAPSNEDEIIMAVKDGMPLIVLMEDAGGIIFRNYMDGNHYALNSYAEYLEFVNRLNNNARLVKYFIDDENSLVMNAWMPKNYNKKSFEAILKLIIQDVGEILFCDKEINRFLG